MHAGSASAAVRADPQVPLQQSLDLAAATGVRRIALASHTVYRVRGEPLALSGKHSGISLIGLPGSSVSGGVLVPPERWAPSRDFAGLWHADVSDIVDGLDFAPRQLWIGSRRAPRSRLRDEEFKAFISTYSADGKGYTVATSQAWSWARAGVEFVYTAQVCAGGERAHTRHRFRTLYRACTHSSQVPLPLL
jgi:hypothetical protein